MDASVASSDVPALDAQLPPRHQVGDVLAPKAPKELAAVGLEEGVLTDLGVRRRSRRQSDLVELEQ